MLRYRGLPVGKPSGAVSLDLGHPLVRKLAHIYPLFFDDLAARDSKGKADITFGSTTAKPGWGYHRSGLVLTFDGGDNAYHTAAAIKGASAFPIVMVACGYFSSTADNYPLIGMGRSGGSAGADSKQIRLNSSTALAYRTMENFGTVANVSVTVGSITSATMYCCVAQSLSSTDHRFYVNGLQGASATNTGNPAGVYNKIGLGASWSDGSGAPAKKHNGGLLFGAVGFEALTDSEALEISKNPGILWEMFAPTRIWVPVSVGGGVSGSIAATESGSDTFASTGKIIVAGSLAATESGSDTFAGSGSTLGGIIGTMAATESGSDTFASTGKIIVAGSLVATESGSDAFASTGKVLVQGAVAAVESSSDNFAADGDVLVSGSLAATESGSDTFAGSGSTLGGIIGTMAATEAGADSFAAAGTVTDPVPEPEHTGSGGVTPGKVTRDWSLFDSPVPIRGSMGACEVGQDGIRGFGAVRVIDAPTVSVGAMQTQEASADGFSSRGQALVYLPSGLIITAAHHRRRAMATRTRSR